MKNDIIIYKKVYDETYTNVENYNYFDEVKNVYVDTFATYIEGKILDAGCGEGIHFKRLLSNGYDVFGIELSEVCCNKYLGGFPHKNIDIVSFAELGQQFSGIICMDVLEHIPLESIDDTISALRKMSSSVFLGIANHSDIINGIELHLIQQDANWWVSLLRNFFKDVIILDELYDGKFFFIQCDNSIRFGKRAYETRRQYISLQKAALREQEMFQSIKASLEQEKVTLMQSKDHVEQEKAALEQIVSQLRQEKAILYSRYRYFEKVRNILKKSLRGV